MKVLMISGDKNLLKEGAEASKRLALQRAQVEQLDVYVWPQVHSKWEIWRAARKNRYDVITSQDPFFRGLFGWKLAHLTGAKLNVQVHTDLSAQSWWRRVMAQIVLRHADSIRVVSTKLEEQVKRIGVRGRAHVLPIYVELERFCAVEPKPHEQKIILWIGRFEKEKDPISALQIVEEVRARGVDAKLVMLGSGSLDRVLKLHAKSLPVEFPGWGDPVQYLETADVVVSTSRHESYGASIVEALAAGVPVVSPDYGVAKEAGAIVVPREDFTKAVIDVLKNPRPGVLKIQTYTKEEWAKKWKESLV